MKLFRSIVLSALCSCPAYLLAQTVHNGAHELSLSEGILSYSEWSGILGESTEGQAYVGFPSRMNGATFLTYRHFPVNRFAIGVTGGIDNQAGPLKDIGSYRRQVYTGAIEGELVYTSRWHVETYCVLGVGYTTANWYFHVNPPYLFSSFTPRADHYNARFNYWNAQVTPIGFRSNGKLAWFCEFGFGYKGMICAGLSARIGAHNKFDKLAADAVIVLPPSFPFNAGDEPEKICAAIRTEIPWADKHSNIHEHVDSICLNGGNFSVQLDTLKMLTARNKANVLKVTTARDPNIHDHFRMGGRAYHIADTSALRKSIASWTRMHYDDNKCAYIVLYRPSHYDALNRNIVTVDTGVYRLRSSSKVEIKVVNEGRHVVGNTNGKLDIDVRFGNTYYIKCYFDPRAKGYYLLKETGKRGEIESGCIRRGLYLY